MKLKHRLQKTLFMPFTCCFGYNNGFTLLILYFDTGSRARALFAFELDISQRQNKKVNFDIFWLSIKIP